MLLLVSCEILDNDPDKHVKDDKDSTYIALEEVAQILSDIRSMAMMRNIL